MATHEEKKSRIEAARQLGSLVAATADVRDSDARHAMAHDQIADAVRGICKPNGKSPFTAAQVDCLIQIGFQIAFVMDPKNKPRRGVWGRMVEGWREARWGEKATIVVAFPGAIVALIGVGIFIASFFPVERLSPISSTGPDPQAENVQSER